MMTPADQALWDSFWHAPTPAAKAAARAAVVTRYTPTTPAEITRISGYYCKNTDDIWDAIGHIFVAINSRIEAFDGSCKFESFICQRARGEISDYARQNSIVKRQAAARGALRTRVVGRFMATHGRYPDEAELRNLITAQLLHSKSRVGPPSPGVLSRMAERTPSTIFSPMGSHFDDPTTPAIARALSIDDPQHDPDAMRGILKGLSQEEIEIVRGHYYEGLTFKEVGAIIGKSESRISQIHANLLDRLRSNRVILELKSCMLK